MYPHFKKFTLLDETISSVLTSNTIPAQHYLHIVEKWKCLDCKHEGGDDTFIWRSKVISQTENTHSSEMTFHCPKCDSRNIKRPDPPKIKFCAG